MEHDLSERNMLIERKNHEMEIISIRSDEERKRMASEHAQMVSLIGNVAHDLKTPLQSVGIDLESLKAKLITVNSILLQWFSNSLLYKAALKVNSIKCAVSGCGCVCTANANAILPATTTASTVTTTSTTASGSTAVSPSNKSQVTNDHGEDSIREEDKNKNDGTSTNGSGNGSVGGSASDVEGVIDRHGCCGAVVCAEEQSLLIQAENDVMQERDVLALINGMREGVTSVDYSCTFMKSAINRSLDFTKATKNIALSPSLSPFDIRETLSWPMKVRHFPLSLDYPRTPFVALFQSYLYQLLVPLLFFLLIFGTEDSVCSCFYS